MLKSNESQETKTVELLMPKNHKNDKWKSQNCRISRILNRNCRKQNVTERKKQLELQKSFKIDNYQKNPKTVRLP